MAAILAYVWCMVRRFLARKARHMTATATITPAPTRPALRWHGGKWLLAPWIISHFPSHRVYVEPFGGAASVLLRKPRSYAEIYNDLDDEVVALFGVLRGPRAGELAEALRLTPFARAEFDAAYADAGDDFETARRLVIRTFMGFGSDGHNRLGKTGFRSSLNQSGRVPAKDWKNYPDALEALIARLAGVTIEHRDAVIVMASHDGPATLHYVDPPYLPETRSQKSCRGGTRYHAYTHELTNEDHACLLAAVLALEGMVVLSGYPSALYDDALTGWRRVERAALADGARPRTEVLWLNPACAAALKAQAALVAQADMQRCLL